MKLIGKLSPRGTLKGSLSAKGTLNGTLTVPSAIGYKPYEGEYTITPKAKESTTLPTNGKVLSDDITVVKIPYYETSNVKGSTVYIANEV